MQSGILYPDIMRMDLRVATVHFLFVDLHQIRLRTSSQRTLFFWNCCCLHKVQQSNFVQLKSILNSN